MGGSSSSLKRKESSTMYLFLRKASTSPSLKPKCGYLFTGQCAIYSWYLSLKYQKCKSRDRRELSCNERSSWNNWNWLDRLFVKDNELILNDLIWNDIKNSCYFLVSTKFSYNFHTKLPSPGMIYTRAFRRLYSENFSDEKDTHDPGQGCPAQHGQERFDTS